MKWRLRNNTPTKRPFEGVVTAQQQYKVMIDTVISPRLRELGFKGSGGRYELGSTSHWALLGFQKSAYSDRQTVRFTVNLTAVERDVWARGAEEHPYWGKRPSAGVIYGAMVPNERIGRAAGREDTWWDVRAGEDSVATAREVLADIEQFALPWLRSHMG
jgi:Domain of unknown function (DUF4304)